MMTGGGGGGAAMTVGAGGGILIISCRSSIIVVEPAEPANSVISMRMASSVSGVCEAGIRIEG